MEELIRRGVPQRTGHEVVGHLVSLAEKTGVRLVDLPDDDFRAAHPKLDPSVRATLGVANAVKAFRSYGSTAPGEVARQLDGWKGRLGLAEGERKAEGGKQKAE